jgi:hypothetical protein
MNRIVVVMLLCAATTAGAQVISRDSLQPPDTVITDTAQRIDAPVFYKPLAMHGRLASIDTAVGTHIHKSDFQRVQFTGVPELLARTTPWLPLPNGGLGQHNAVLIAGALPREQSWSVNARPLIDAWSGQFHAEQLAPESYERVEVVTGTDAVGLAPTISTVGVNAQDALYNTAPLFMRLWYSQGVGDFIAGDAAFAQNIAPNLNVSFGVRRAGARGEYARTGYDVWNVRLGARWFPSASSTYSINYALSSFNTQLWGGLDTALTTDVADEASAVPVYYALEDQTRRHDVTLGWTELLGADTSSVLYTTAWFTSSDLRRIDTVEIGVRHARTVGATSRFEQRLGSALLRIAALAQWTDADQTPWSTTLQGLHAAARGHISIPLGAVTLRAAAHVAQQDDSTKIGLGGAIDVPLGEGSSGSVDASLAGTSLFAQLTYRLSTGSSWYDAGAWTRMSTDDNSSSLYGLHASTRWNVGGFSVAPLVRLMFSTPSEDDPEWPLLSGHVDVFYTYTVNRNSVSAGARATVFSPMHGPSFDPWSWSYGRSAYVQEWRPAIVDLWLSAFLGNAAVRVSWENILGRAVWTTSVAPSLQQNFRLTVSWSFFD